MVYISNNKSSKFDFFIGFFPIFLFLIYLTWASCLPVSQSPDEFNRLKVPFFIAENGYLPSGFEESIRVEFWGTSYAFTTYGASLISVIFIKIAMIFTSEMATWIFAARIPSCIFGALTIATLLKSSKLLGFNNPSRLSLAICLGLLPQFVFLSSYHNADIFSAFCVSLVILCWIIALKRGWNLKTCTYLGISLGLLALSYYFAYLAIPISIAFFCFTAKWQKLTFKKALSFALLIFAIAFAIAGWFFIRNFIIYNGDFIGLRAFEQCGEMYGDQAFKPSNFSTPKIQGLSMLDILFSKEWILTTFKSSISYLGYMEFSLRKLLYIPCLFAVITTILLSLKITFVDQRKDIVALKSYDSKEAILIWVLLAILAIGTLFLSLYRTWAVDYQAQGRYIISAWIVIFLAFGSSVNYITGNILKTDVAKIAFISLIIVYSLVLLTSAAMSVSDTGFQGITYNTE